MTNRLAVCIALLAVASPASADLYNARNYLMGERGATMGGAYTALSDDVSGAFYNPGGLAFIERSTISLSGDVYGYSFNNRTVVFGDNPGAKMPLNFLTTLPTTMGAAKKFGERWVVAVAFFGLDMVQLSGLSDLDGAHITVPKWDDGGLYTTYRGALKVNDLTFLAGPSVGYRVLPGLGVGVSLFTHVFQGSFSASDDFLVSGSSREVLLQTSNEALSVGLVPMVGVRWTSDFGLSAGVNYSAETIPLYGRNNWALKTSTPSVNQNDGGREHGYSNRLPHRISFGAAYRLPGSGFLISVDAINSFGLDYASPHDLWLTADPNARHRERPHLDFSGGIEAPLSQRWVLHAGFFTNRSNAPKQTYGESVDLYGITFGLTRLHNGLSATAGIQVAYGQALKNPDPFLDARINWDRLQTLFMIAGTYEPFLRDTDSL
jgi:long-chain fatty acid transport protein